MKVLGISGSPRIGGNSEILLDAALKTAEEYGAETVKIRLCELDYEACRECHGCDDTGECIVEDDMQEIFPQLIECDRLFLATPVFFMGISAQTKAMIDRCQCIWVRKFRMNQTIGKGREHRKGLLMAVGGSKNPEKFIAPQKVVRAFYATLDITYDKELLAAGVDEKGAILDHSEYIDEVKDMALELISG